MVVGVGNQNKKCLSHENFQALLWCVGRGWDRTTEETEEGGLMQSSS